MAVYNGAAYLREAVESILSQTYTDFEFIVVDDGSNDDSLQILQSYVDRRLRILRSERNVGLTVSLNKGLDAARGELVARQDADDISHPCRLEKQVAFLDAHPRVVVVGTQARYIDSAGNPSISLLWKKATTPEALRLQILFDNPFFHTSVLFRREIVHERLGGYDPSFRTSQDFELWSRLLQQFDGANLGDVLVDQRYHLRSASATYQPANARQVAGVFARNLQIFLGDFPEYTDWPQLWSSLMNPHMSPEYSPREVFCTIQSICNAYTRNRLSPLAVTEVNAQRAITSLRAARFMARTSLWAAFWAATKVFFISPLLVASEIDRLLRRAMRASAPHRTELRHRSKLSRK
jgi:hypothetical protein